MTEKNRTGKGHPDDAALQEKRRLAGEIIERLEKEYPDAGCTLDYDDAWKLLVSVQACGAVYGCPCKCSSRKAL